MKLTNYLFLMLDLKILGALLPLLCVTAWSGAYVEGQIYIYLQLMPH
jgi:hypothetical protein